MKSFRIDDAAAISPDSIKTAALNASKRKRNRRDVQRRLNHIEDTIAEIQGMILAGEYTPRRHEPVTINRTGPHKERQIITPTSCICGGSSRI